MKRLLTSFVLFFACSLMAQQPILRNAMTTNIAGTPVLSRSDLSVTNVGSGTNWLFYGTAPNTVARLVDIALGAGTLWATVVSNSDGSVTVYTNTANVGTNIYGLSSAAFVNYASNALQTSMSNTVSYVSNILNTGIVTSSNKAHLDLTNLTVLVSNNMHLDLTNLNVVTSNALQTSMSNTVSYVSNILTGADIASSNKIHLDMTNYIVATSNSLQGSMSNTVSYVSNILTGADTTLSNNIHLDLTNLTVLVSNATHLDMTNLVNASSNNFSIKTNMVAGVPTTTYVPYIQANGSIVWTNLAVGSGAQWATVVSNANGTITVYTNSSVTGTNIYGLAVADPLTLTEVDATTLAITNVIGYLNATNMAPTNGVAYEGQVLTVTAGTGGTNMYWGSPGVTTAQLNSAASNRVVVTPGANVTVTTNSPAANVMAYTVSSSSIFGEAWFVWGSSNTLATNAGGVAYKAMQRSDVVLPATPNTNTYTTPTAGQYIGEVVTAIPAGLTTIVPGDINTVSFAYLSENRTMVIEPEIYIRTNMIAPSWSALGEKEIGVGSQFTLNNTFQTVTISVPITTNVTLYATNYLVRKYKVVSVSGGTPNVLMVSQGQYPARVVFPVGSAAFVLKTGDTMSGNLTLPTAIATTSLIVTGSVISGNSQTSTVVNAQWNTLDNVSIGATISGGEGNMINTLAAGASSWSTIGGGFQNDIRSACEASTISGGEGNSILENNTFSFIGGGYLNTVDLGNYSVVVGGSENNVNGGVYNSIGGGNGNEISDSTGYSVLSGGRLNRVLGEYGSIIGGYLNTNASGSYGTILGGYSNRVAGNYTVAAGALSSAAAAGAWMISDSSQTNKVNSTADSFKAKFANGYVLEGGYLSATLSSNYQSIWIDAGAMATNATGGPTVGYYTATNFNGIYSDVWDFDSATPQTNYFKLMLPDSWDAGTIKVKFFYFTTAVAASTSNMWGVCAQAVSPGDLFGFRGTEVTVSNLVQDATNKLNVCTSPAITVGGTPALGNMVHFQVRRVADDGWDNSAGNARLLGVAVQWQDKRNNPAVW